MRALIGSLWLLWLLAGASAAQADAGALAQLRTSELEYARALREAGPGSAAREFLADDAVLLRPRAVPAREWLESRVWPDGVVEWRPGQIELSCSGDLGFGLGPWSYLDPDGHAAGSGWTLLLWRRDPEAERWWIVLEQSLDASVAGASGASDGLEPAAASAVGDCAAVADEALAETEEQLNAEIARRGYREALLRFAVPGLQLLRDGGAPAPAAALAPSAVESSFYAAVTRRRYASAGGDLALSHGELEPGAEPRRRGQRKARAVAESSATAREGLAVYLRLWRHDGRHWRVVFDSLVAVSAADAAPP